MGSTAEFKCEACGLKAAVSGGFDVGFVSAVQTVSCKRCGILADIEVGVAETTHHQGLSLSDRRCATC